MPLLLFALDRVIAKNPELSHHYLRNGLLGLVALLLIVAAVVIVIRRGRRAGTATVDRP